MPKADELKEAKKRLKEYIEIDNKYEKDGDFGEFCNQHCNDILNILQALEDKDKEIEKQNKIIDIMAWSMTHEDIPTDEYCKIRTMGCEFMGVSTYEYKECVKEYFRKKVENE